MIYVFPSGSIIYDGSTLTEEQKSRAVAIKSLPEPEKIEGKIPVLKVNKDAKEVYYEYEDEPEDLDAEKEIKALKQSQQEQDALIMQIMLGGM